MRSLLLAALAWAPLAAQQTLVVPQACTNSEGNTASGMPGLGGDGATQVLIAASHLQGLIGHTIVGLAFRRDGAWLAGLPQSDGQIVVRIGASTRDPLDPAPDFATNLPGGTEVYRGPLVAPAMPPIQGFVGWTAPHVVEISFAQGFAYAGGPLAVEIEGSVTSTPTFYPLDGVDEALAVPAIDVGHACGPRASLLVRTALRSGSGFVPGGTTQLHLAGTAGNAALACFGASLLPQPVALDFLGAPGCTWYVDVFAAMRTSVVPTSIDVFGALATVRLQLPGSSALLGGQLFVQWLEFGSTGPATSQAMQLSIASQLPSLGMAQLERMSDGSVIVSPATGPVVAFRWL